MGGIVGGVGAAIGLGENLFGGSGSSIAPPPTQALGTQGGNPATYIPTGQSGADQQYQSMLAQYGGAAGGLPGQVLGAASGAFGNILNNPYAARAQGYADTAGNAAWQALAPNAFSSASTLFNQGQQAAPYGQSILQTGFDPQSALYNRMQQQVQDRANATNAMYGLGSSPYGAGVANESMNNFNIDWQNQQLKRQAESIQGYGQLQNAIGRDFAGSADLNQIGIGAYQQAGQLPYQAYQGRQNDIFGGLSALTGAYSNAFGPTQQLFGDLGNYLRLGQGASNLAQTGQQSQYGQAIQNQDIFGSNLIGLGNALGGGYNSLGALFGGSSGGGGYGTSGSPDMSGYGGMGGGFGGGDPFYGMDYGGGGGY